MEKEEEEKKIEERKKKKTEEKIIIVILFFNNKKWNLLSFLSFNRMLKETFKEEKETIQFISISLHNSGFIFFLLRQQEEQ